MLANCSRLGLRGVVAVLPVGIVADRVDDEAPHHPVAAGHLGGLRGHRHQRVHEVGKRHAPDPRVHAAHRVAHHQPHVLDAEPFGQQAVLRRHHVVVVVARELGALAVRRLGRLSMADGIGNDDEVLGRVERLAGAEQFAAECRRQHARRGAGGAMQHQHRLAAGCTDRGVAQLQFGHHLAGVELEVACDPAGLLGGRKLRGQHLRRPTRRRPMTREAVASVRKVNMVLSWIEVQRR